MMPPNVLYCLKCVTAWWFFVSPSPLFHCEIYHHRFCVTMAHFFPWLCICHLRWLKWYSVNPALNSDNEAQGLLSLSAIKFLQFSFHLSSTCWLLLQPTYNSYKYKEEKALEGMIRELQSPHKHQKTLPLFGPNEPMAVLSFCHDRAEDEVFSGSWHEWVSSVLQWGSTQE